MNWITREAAPKDLPTVAALVRRAFPGPHGEEIADLATALFGDPTARPMRHLLAIQAERIVGQIIFSKAPLVGQTQRVSSRILAPLSVDPEFQGQGIGRRLVEDGLGLLREEGVPFVFVLGDPRYYGRFGFQPALDFGLEAPGGSSEAYGGAWQVLELEAGALSGVSGKVNCADCLRDPKYWVE